MKKIKVPILTEEYKILVCIGTIEELITFTNKYAPAWDKQRCSALLNNSRGVAWNCLPEEHPLITIDETLSFEEKLATLPHEASHAMQYIMDYLGIEDASDEVRGHGISAVMRHCIKYLQNINNNEL